jgi:hypothetical protein
MAPCRYRPLLLVDTGDDFRSPMAALSQTNAAAHYARINDFIKAVFTVNQLISYISKDYARKGGSVTVAEALALYQNPDDDFRPEFRLRIKQLFDSLDRQREEAEQQTTSTRKRVSEQAQWAELDAIRQMGLPPFEAFIEAITYIRTPFHRGYWVELADSLLLKNSDNGLLRQGRAQANGRRFHIGSQLLEVLVQLAILEPVGPAEAGGFRSRPMLIDTFVQWLLDRYGLVINGLDVPAWAARAEMPVPEWAQRTGMRELEAYRENLRALKDRLREIGFYTDLSDAYNAQTIRPRYSLETSR